MIEIVIIATIIVTALTVSFLFAQSKTEKAWLIPLVGILLTPILPKVGLAPGIYAHPASFIFASLLLASAWKFKRSLINMAVAHRPMSQSTRLILLVIISWTTCLMLGLVVAMIRWQELQWSEVLRNILYVTGFATFIPAYIATKKLPRVSLTKFSAGLVISISVLALIAISRVIWYVASGEEIDFWTYDPDSHAIGLLGQYIDWSGLHLIPSSANENAGWLFSLGAFVSLLFAARSSTAVRQLMWMAASIGLSVVMLFTLSRASLVLWFGGMLIMLGYILRSWRDRGLALGIIGLAAVITVLLFPQAPFVEKALNTVSVNQVEVEEPDDSVNISTPNQPTQSTAIATGTEKGSSKKVELDLEPSSQGRVKYWQQTLSAIRSDGWMAAIGQGEVNLQDKFDGLVTHSLLLQNTILYGALGLVVFILTWVVLLHFGFCAIRRPVSSVEIVAVPLAAVVPGWLLSNLIFGGSFLSIELLVVSFGLLGVVCARIDHPGQSA